MASIAPELTLAALVGDNLCRFRETPVKNNTNEASNSQMIQFFTRNGLITARSSA